jgi:hypothetical protein
MSIEDIRVVEVACIKKARMGMIMVITINQ